MEFEIFPEGQFVAVSDDRVVGYATSLIVQIDEAAHLYTYHEITGSGTFSTHFPGGDTLYGADIAVHPDFRGMGVASKLYEARKKLVRRYNLRRMLAYGRLPGFPEYAGEMTADQYVEKVVAGKLSDSALNAHLKAGYSVRQVLLRFVPDKASLDYSTLLEWPNPEFNADKRRIAASPLKGPVRKARVCAAQFMMRRIDTWDEFANTVEFFVDTADAYHCHFLVLPELFTTQLMYTMPPDFDTHQAITRLHQMTDRYIDLLKGLAEDRQLYIIGGSHPVRRGDKIYNTAHLFTPSGKVYTQDKIHVTPTEREVWDITPGEVIRVFDTPLARVAIQICYDIEFPEVSRLLALAGVEIFFVPFSTDEKKAYNRVRYCAQARAVENYVYVVLSGNVGNLPTIKNYLINYGQSAILTPSDLAFPSWGILSEADPNVETVVISDLDLNTLAQQRELGSVRPFHDRRPDLYTLKFKNEIEIVRTE
jgi:predicted amidohydrolase/GNAT superfamily N-acetyltransferase